MKTKKDDEDEKEINQIGRLVVGNWSWSVSWIAELFFLMLATIALLLREDSPQASIDDGIWLGACSWSCVPKRSRRQVFSGRATQVERADPRQRETRKCWSNSNGVKTTLSNAQATKMAMMRGRTLLTLLDRLSPNDTFHEKRPLSWQNDLLLNCFI